jgi:NAD(P)-dependent dehydrogenase (short-subunit alcohol dehydrogenase family)
VLRQVVRLTAIGEREPVHLPAAGDIWIVSNGSMIAGRISELLKERGHPSRLWTWREMPLREIPSTLAGLVLIAPERDTTDAILFQAFRWLKLTAPALRANGRAQGAALLGVIRLDGAFGFSELDSANEPLAGGLTGMIKTAACEWPEVCCKTVDLAPPITDPNTAAKILVEELLTRGPVEVGVTATARQTPTLEAAPLDTPIPADFFAADDVIVVSGGARGVTAEVSVALAQTYRPKLVLLGRSPLPRPEPEWLANLTDPAEIKRALANRQNGPVTPRLIGEQCQAILAEREIKRNLSRIEAAGGRGAYCSVDIADAQAVAKILDEVRRLHGPITGLIHGAGIIADKRIEDKQLDAFERVYRTKVDGLRALLAATVSDPLRLLALFSSTTARLGRVGQVAYACANEVLNKFAQQHARRRPGCRVISFNWGPWEGGMVTPSLQSVFAAEGVGLIPLRAGAEALLAELGAKPPSVEVVLLGTAAPPAPPAAATEPISAQQDSAVTPSEAATEPADSVQVAPMLAAEPAAPPEPTGPGMSLVFQRDVSVWQCPILRSHVIAGQAVLPMALHIEWLAHAAMHGYPGLGFHGLNELRIYSGVRLDQERSHTVTLWSGKARRQLQQVVVPVEMRGLRADGREVLHSRAQVVLHQEPPSDKPRLTLPELQPYPHPHDEIYRNFLFHGPDLQGIVSVEGIAETAIVGQVKNATPPASWLQQPLRGTWLTDPLVLDAAFQLMILWSFAQHGAGSLPCFAGRYRQYRKTYPPGGARVVATITHDNGRSARATMEFLDATGGLIARLEDYECVIDAELNDKFRQNQPLSVTTS